MWIQFLIFYLLGLAVLIGGAIYYYFLIYEKPWNSINIWTKIGFLGLVFLESVIVFSGIFYLLFSLIGKKKVIKHETRRLNANNFFEFFEGLSGDDKFKEILYSVFRILFTFDLNYQKIELTFDEDSLIKQKISSFVDFYRFEKDKIDQDFILRQSGNRFDKYIFYLVPSNRFIAYYFNMRDYLIDVENPRLTRMSHDKELRKESQDLCKQMIRECEREGMTNIPTTDFIQHCKRSLEKLNDLIKYVPSPEVSSAPDFTKKGYIQRYV